MGDVIEVGWFIDNDGRTYLGRITAKARRIEIENVTPRAQKALNDQRKRLDRAKRQA